MRAKIGRAGDERQPRQAGWAALAVLLLAGCTTDYVDGRRIGGVAWRAVDINGLAVTGTAPTLQLVDGRVTGTGGCNSFSGTYRIGTKERIDIAGLSSTEMACDAAIMDQERRYLSILQSAQGYDFYGDGSLSLVAADGRAVRFRSR